MRNTAIAALAAVSIVGAQTASAQSVGEAAVAACRAAHGEDDAAGRIACLERALLGVAAPAPEPRRAFAPPAPREEEPALNARIVEISYGASGLGRFVLEDGQVWRETVATPARQRLRPGRTYDARIERSVLGGYRMNVDGVRRELKVEPLN